jgi:hypothetical protein
MPIVATVGFDLFDMAAPLICNPVPASYAEWGQEHARTIPLPDIDFHAQTRYTEVTLSVQSDPGRAGMMKRKSVLRSVTGAITCAAVGNLSGPAFSEAATLPCSS